MRMDQFTVKAQEAIAAGADRGGTRGPPRGHAGAPPPGARVPGRRRRSGRPGQDGRERGRDPPGRRARRSAALPHTQGAATQLSPRLDAVFKAALKEAEALKDDYISTEHLLIALADSKTPAGEILKRHGVTQGRHPQRSCARSAATSA